MRKLSVITLVNDDNKYHENVILSTIKDRDNIEYVTVKNSKSGASGLNSGIDKATNDVILCCHQDVYFKEGWYEKLNKCFDELDTWKSKTWGVIGFAGTTDNGLSVGTHSGLGMTEDIIMVQTLDESVLILKKSNKLKFDERLLYYHMYGTDISLQSYDRGLNVYVINVPIEHRTKWTAGNGIGESEAYIKKKWINKYNIIHTTVGNIESDEEFIRRCNEDSNIIGWKRHSLRH